MLQTAEGVAPSALAFEERRRTYHTLDALRGMAALIVLTRHSDWLFSPLQFSESFLAVDLFFVMSGVVIANAYENKLLEGRMTAGRFLALRVVRLYPLYILGLMVALVQFVGNSIEWHRVDLSQITAALGLAVLMIPASGKYIPTLDTPRWSLFFEMFANVCYSVFIGALRTPVLWSVALVSAFGLLAAGSVNHSLDGGFDLPTAWVGIVRVSFSFTFGVLLWRYRAKVTARIAPLSAWASVAVTALILVAPVPPALRPPYEEMMVLVGFPALVWAAMQFDVAGQTQRIFSVLGVTSYAVYVLHQPAALLYSAIQKRVIHLRPDWSDPLRVIHPH